MCVCVAAMQCNSVPPYSEVSPIVFNGITPLCSCPQFGALHMLGPLLVRPELYTQEWNLTSKKTLKELIIKTTPYKIQERFLLKKKG